MTPDNKIAWREQLRQGFEAARDHRSSPPHPHERSLPESQLPFHVTPPKELLRKFEEIQGGMETKIITQEEAYRMLLEENLPWRISPTTEYGRTRAELHYLGKYANAQEKHPESKSWRHLEPIHHARAHRRAQDLWTNYKGQLLNAMESDLPEDASPTLKRLQHLYQKNQTQIQQKIKDLRGKNSQLGFEEAQEEAVDKILGTQFIKARTNNLKATMAHHHHRKLQQPDQLNQEILQTVQQLTDIAEQANFTIGRSPDRKFFDVHLIRVTVKNPNTGQVKYSYIASILEQEPKLTDDQKRQQAAGLVILPYYLPTHQTSSGNTYIFIALRSEPGATTTGQAVVVAGEQTSNSKLTGGDVLNQPGGAYLAICVQEKLAIDCPPVEAFTDLIPSKFNAVLAHRDTNRLSGSHNAYGAVEVNEQLLQHYDNLAEKGMGYWVNLREFEALLEETKTKHPLANELLLAAKGQLDQLLRDRAELEAYQLRSLLHEISTQPAAQFGWLVGGLLNWLESALHI